MSTNRYIDKLKARLAKEADRRMQLQALLDDQVARNRALLAERDAILLQARIWAGEAKSQKATVDEVGKILGGVPDWGPIAAGVAQLKKDAERYRWLRNSERFIGECADDHEFNICVSTADGEDVLWFGQLDAVIDAALQGEQP